MINIFRNHAREINKLIRELEFADLKTLSEEDAIARIEKIESLLKSYGIENSGDYQKRLEGFSDKADNFYSSNRQFDFEGGIRDYVGMSGHSKIRVKPVFDHVFFERVYGGKIKLSWRFNSEGRLDLADAMIFPKNDIWNLIKTVDFGEAPHDWSSRKVLYKPLPRDIYLVNLGFSYLGPNKKYESLMRFGHSMAGDLLRNLEKGEIRDSYIILAGQRQLREIVNDAECLHMLGKAGELLPYVAGKNGNCLMVEYGMNER